MPKRTASACHAARPVASPCVARDHPGFVADLTRRQLLLAGLYGPFALRAARAQAPPPATAAAPRTDRRGQVLEVDAPGLVAEDGAVDAAVAARTVDRALTSFTGDADPVSALARFVRPADTVGLKVDLTGGPRVVFHRALTDRLLTHLGALGVPPERILVFDQLRFRMVRAGYPPLPAGPADGKTRAVRFLHHEAEGWGYEEARVPFDAKRTWRWAKLLTRCSAILNLHAAKDHRRCGVSGALVNMALGCIDDAQPLHGVLDRAVPAIYAHPTLRGRVRLSMCDAGYVLRQGGPQDQPAHRVLGQTVLIATDPVAMDWALVEKIEAERASAKLPSLYDVDRPRERPPLHVSNAAALGLGAPIHELRWERIGPTGERTAITPRRLRALAPTVGDETDPP